MMICKYTSIHHHYPSITSWQSATAYIHRINELESGIERLRNHQEILKRKLKKQSGKKTKLEVSKLCDLGMIILYSLFSPLLHHFLNRIAGNFQGRKLSWISQFCGYSRKFSPWNLGVWHPLARPVHKSFLHKNLINRIYAELTKW